MAEEPGAGGHSADDEPADEDPDDGAGSDGASAPDAPSDVPTGRSRDGDDAGATPGEEEGPEADPEESGSADDDVPEPVGAVRDADAPPAASAPGVEDDAGADGPARAGADGHDESGDGPPTEEVGDLPAGLAGVETYPDPADGDQAVSAGGAGTADESDVVGGTGEAGEDRDYYSRTVPEENLPVGDDEGAPAGTRPAREGPPDDEEMPLADHIEEMVLRLAIVAAVAAVVAGAVFFFEPLAEDTIMFIWNSVLPDPEQVPDDSAVQVATNPRVYGPLELKLAELKFASLAGFVLALPVFVYETYRFMRPGLYPRERRYYLAAVPTSLVLAFVGVSFAYFIILPAIFAYFVRYSERAGLLAFALRQTFDLIIVLMGYMALVFQIPLFIMLAIMMGLTDRRWLEDRRLYFWGGFLGVSFLFVPEPTGMAPILVALTMIGLFEGTLGLLRWTGN